MSPRVPWLARTNFINRGYPSVALGAKRDNWPRPVRSVSGRFGGGSGTLEPRAPRASAYGRIVMAVAEGFEPSDGFSRHTLSRRAP